MPRRLAPLGQALQYRRAAGESPQSTGSDRPLNKHGWRADLGARGLGDTLLALALVRALIEAAPDRDVTYTGPLPRLIGRSSLAVTVQQQVGPHIFGTLGSDPVPFQALPEEPPTWLDVLDDENVEVHAALPMRYYLATEQRLGSRLPATHSPCPEFRSTEHIQPFHVVFVNATSWPGRKDYGIAGFATIAERLAQRRSAPWRFSILSGEDIPTAVPSEFELFEAPDAPDCVDLFASAEVVVGNDTGLTHLAAMTTDGVGSRPDVIGIYGRHSHTKWTTGSPAHHAVATPFAQMLAAADRCPVRDNLDDSLWASAADISTIPADDIAEFIGRSVGWW